MGIRMLYLHVYFKVSGIDNRQTRLNPPVNAFHRADRLKALANTAHQGLGFAKNKYPASGQDICNAMQDFFLLKAGKVYQGVTTHNQIA
jgi:hypothetical protein